MMKKKFTGVNIQNLRKRELIVGISAALLGVIGLIDLFLISPSWAIGTATGALVFAHAWNNNWISTKPIANPIGDRVKKFDEWSPEWIDRWGKFHTVETTHGMPVLEKWAKKIPEKYWSKWATFSMLSMGTFVVIWFFIFAYITYEGFLFGSEIYYEMDFLAAREPPDISALEMAVTVAVWSTALLLTVAYFLLLLPLYILLFLVLIPGIALHELGHFVAMVRNDIEVEAYGILFLGPLPAGAFVKPTDDEWDEKKTLGTKLQVFSSGISANIAYGAFFAVIALPWLGFSALDSSNPVAMTALYVFLILSIIEFINAFFNSIPLWKLDGGHFFKGISGNYRLKERLSMFRQGTE